MSTVRSDALQQQRYQATIFSVFASLAILLAALGLYGLIAQSVAQRTREMGIRLALGATVQGVIRTAAVPGIVLSLAGIACGTVLALFASRLLKGLVWGVPNTDPITFVVMGLLLIAVAGLASIVPALRLARLDPAQTLRDE
jgi:ABC-type antimicrobial peptide transport system permease subunit